MRFTAGLVFIASALTSALALKNPPADLQVGIMKRIPASECTVRSSNGDTLSMHYTGKLFDGDKFDSSLDRDQPFDFVLGQGQVIKGWDRGLLNMCIGEKRKLTIPPHLGYGDQGAGNAIPPKATLVFDVELLDIKKGKFQKGPAFGSAEEVGGSDNNIISFTSPSFLLSTGAILGLFYFVFKLAKKQDIVEAKKASTAEAKEKK